MSSLASFDACSLLLLTSEEPKAQVAVPFVTECQNGWMGVFMQKIIHPRSIQAREYLD